MVVRLLPTRLARMLASAQPCARAMCSLWLSARPAPSLRLLLLAFSCNLLCTHLFVIQQPNNFKRDGSGSVGYVQAPEPAAAGCRARLPARAPLPLGAPPSDIQGARAKVAGIFS